MLTSGHDTTRTPMNSQYLWLLAREDLNSMELSKFQHMAEGHVRLLLPLEEPAIGS